MGPADQTYLTYFFDFGGYLKREDNVLSRSEIDPLFTYMYIKYNTVRTQNVLAFVV